MKRAIAVLLGIILVLACAGCTSEQAPVASPRDPESNPQVEALSLPAPAESADPGVVTGVNATGIDMLQRLYPDMKGDNYMISPLSISLALSMTMNGAEAQTLEQMKEAMHFAGIDTDAVNAAQKDLMTILVNPDGSDKVKVEIANALWACEEMMLTADFQDTCATYYDAGTESLDFADPQTREIIDAWVNQQTHGMIPAILDEPIAPEEVMFLINTLYFDGKWSLPFDPDKTSDGTFTKADGTAVTVPMMSAEEDVMVYTDSDIDCFSKSFGDTGRLEMLFIRPKGALDAFIRDFSPAQLAQIVKDSHEEEILISIPRFSYDTSLKLKEVLTAMGMGDAFIEGTADFTAMGSCGRGPLYVGEALHKTRIEVKEEGARAAAVTGVVMEARGMPTTIALDGPFLYLIRDTRTGAVLFIGVLEEPVEE